MKNILFITLLISLKTFSQNNYSKINSEYNIPDSLTYKTEIRIYQIGELCEYSSLYRMYIDKSGIWKIEFYEDHENKSENNKIKKQFLIPNNNAKLIFTQLLKNHILDLPSEKQIKWKFDNGVTGIIGDFYKFQVRHNGKFNEFEYSEPLSLFTSYPNIDELIYVSNILELLMKEFNIWQM